MIEKLTKEHAAQVYEIEKSCFSAPWSEKSVFDFCRDPSVRGFVFTEEGRVSGYAGMVLVAGEGQILNVAVRTEAQRRGVGECLLAALISEAEKERVGELFLEVRKSNAAAVALYEKFGFVKIGSRRNYYASPTEDALLYKKELL